MNMPFFRTLAVCAGLSLTTACVTSTVDEMTFNEPTEGIGDSSVVILGRRHSSDYETEPDFVACVGDHITTLESPMPSVGSLNIISSTVDVTHAVVSDRPAHTASVRKNGIFMGRLHPSARRYQAANLARWEFG